MVDELSLTYENSETWDNLGAFGVSAGDTWSENEMGYYRVVASNGKYYYNQDYPYYFSDTPAYNNTVVLIKTVKDEEWTAIWSRWVEYDDGTIEQVEYEFTTISKSSLSWSWRYLY
ncbi:MAG: hypothetical protein PHE99_05230 [Bacteroidales bacterium]|nr:hypothetical protein [Bacteroidales bacterium]